MPSIEELLREYGYAFLFAGALAEGETAVALAGVAAHRGYLHLPAVIFVATMGAALGDQVCFQLGRWKGRDLLDARPNWSAKWEYFRCLSERWGTWLILGFRFVYGMRMAGAAAFGATDISTLRFSLLNLAGAILWACLLSGGGYLLGHTLETFLGDLSASEGWIFLTILLAGAALAIARRGRSSVSSTADEC